MKLVPTLEKMVGEMVAKDFWKNHRIQQDALDGQNEGWTSENLFHKIFLKKVFQGYAGVAK